MARANPYRIIDVDLTLARQRGLIVPRDTAMTSVTVLDIPAGATFALHAGERDAIPILDRGFELPNMCGENGGLMATHPAQPGVTVRLYVAFGGTRAALEI